MTNNEIEIWNFGMEVLDKVAVQTHTDFEKHYQPVFEKYKKRIGQSSGESEKYSISDFIYWLEKYNDIDDKKWTQAEIAQIVARGMVDFFPDTNTSY